MAPSDHQFIICSLLFFGNDIEQDTAGCHILASLNPQATSGALVQACDVTRDSVPEQLW